MLGFLYSIFKAAQTANAIASHVKSAFENQSTGPLFNLADNLVSGSRGRGQGRGRGSSRGRVAAVAAVQPQLTAIVLESSF